MFQQGHMCFTRERGISDLTRVIYISAGGLYVPARIYMFQQGSIFSISGIYALTGAYTSILQQGIYMFQQEGIHISTWCTYICIYVSAEVMYVSSRLGI